MTEIDQSRELRKRDKMRMKNDACGGVYGLAIVGAAVYYIRHAPTFWVGLLGILKAIVWPAVLMYKVLELLKM